MAGRSAGCDGRSEPIGVENDGRPATPCPAATGARYWLERAFVLASVAILGFVVVYAGAAALPLIVPDRTRSSPSTEARSGNLQSSAAPFVSGPQATITCPAGAIDISPGTNIQAAVDRHPAGTTFCVKAGVHAVSSHITPKSRDVFIGEYGAILDGTTWTTADPNEAAFRAHNQDIDDVTIRNLVIRHMPRKGIHALHWASDRWTIENNELTACRTGVAAPNQSIVRNNYIHHNMGGGYDAYRVVNLIFEHNEIAYNGREQKIVGATDVTFRDNFVHHNAGDGILVRHGQHGSRRRTEPR